MKTHTQQFKENIAKFGRELDSKITFTIGGVTTELGNEQLNSVSPHYEGAILKSVMKQLDIDSNVEIPVGTEVNYKFGVKTRNGYNLLNVNASSSTINGITFTVNDDKSIAINGTNTGSISWFRLAPNFTLPTGTYTLSNGNNNASNNTFLFIDAGSHFDRLNVSSKTFGSDTTIAPYIRVASGATINNQTIYPMIVKGSYTSETMPSYEPYGAYDYVDYGNYIVKEVEKQEDTRSWKITCYDKMLYAMKEYENSNITFPITIRNYISAICNKLGITFANASDTFANYNKTLNNEVYLDSDGRTLNYTFRDVLDELAQVTASTICINNNDELEIRYINQTVGKNLFNPNDVLTGYISDNTGSLNGTGTATNKSTNYIEIKPNTNYYILSKKDSGNWGAFYNSSKTYISGITSANWTNQGKVVQSPSNAKYLRFTLSYQGSNTNYANNVIIAESNVAIPYEPYGDTIDEEYLKDVNVNFGEKFGPVNTIVLSRGGDGDKISLSQPTNLPDADKIAIQISDNQIMNDNNRDTYMSDILNKLYGLEYYINDFVSTGICYYDLCDKYNIKVGDNFYSCIMLNDEVNITQGLQENIYTDMQEENKQEYKYIGSTDRGITQANIIAKKNEATITEYTQKVDNATNRLNAVETKQTDTERTINIISTNIDANGNITEVTTTNGFTFNSSGMNIHTSENSFNTQISNERMQHKNGDEVITETSKDGFMTTDLRQKNQHFYGWDGQEYNLLDEETTVDGEECYATFWNGSD